MMKRFRILRVFLIPRVICFSHHYTPVLRWWLSSSWLAWWLSCFTSGLGVADGRKVRLRSVANKTVNVRNITCGKLIETKASVTDLVVSARNRRVLKTLPPING